MQPAVVCSRHTNALRSLNGFCIVSFGFLFVTPANLNCTKPLDKENARLYDEQGFRNYPLTFTLLLPLSDL